MLQTAQLTTLLNEALLLDPDHVRQDQERSIKVILQQDAAECYLQLALFEPGRELLSSDTSVLDALRMLLDKAWSEEVRVVAHNTLLALGAIERIHEPEPERESGDDDDDGGWLMMSYQWDHQATVERVVRSLEARGFEVWWDLDR
jgi:hypothetical protein